MLPFIPFYIQEVGVTDPVQVRLWVGLTSSGTAITLAIMAPIWGILGDKWGRKLMILRAMAAGALILFLMSLAKNVQTIFVLRLIQGLFAGTVTAAATLVAAGSPKEKLSYSLGFLASSTFIGFSLGPFFGGLAAEYLGYRRAFHMGALLLAIGFFLVLFLVQDIKPVLEEGKKTKPEPVFDRSFKTLFILLLACLFVARFSRTLPWSFVPLYIQEMRGTIEGSSFATGILSSLIGLAAALSGLTLARLGDKHDKIKLLSFCLGGASLLTFPIFFTKTLVPFAGFYIAAAFLLGAIDPSLQSFITEHTSPARRGFVFGVLTLVGSLGWFGAPLLGSLLSIRFGLSAVFLAFSLLLFVSFLFTWSLTYIRKKLQV